MTSGDVELLSGTSVAGVEGSTTLVLPPPSSVRASAGAYGLSSSLVQPLMNDCSSDGSDGCFVLGPVFSAALKSGAASKILAGQSLGGVAGSINLPDPANVRTLDAVNGVPGSLADCSSNG